MTTDPTAQLFQEIGRRRHISSLESAEGSLRFDVVDDAQVAHWFVEINKGEVSVSQEKRDADCVVHVRKDLSDRIASGRENAIAALLRGEITLEGEPRLLILMERLAPGPPGARDPRSLRSERRQP